MRSRLASTIALLVIPFALASCSQWVLVRDFSGPEPVPVPEAKVTLQTESGVTVSYTGEDGYAYLDRQYSDEAGQMTIEKQGYRRRSLNYPGGLSLLESLYRVDQ